ncbi:hypothetical protein IFM89_037265 [Coptis chinensis]|uniref:Iron hydrogenase small subunit domain-containing protein n=1 Tax=Coptis chinensis TaxID=261450 RepID=A0A835I938_9MAGN|nr:hypothetical protein IFM89_037265 [Coptis chinensis]
MPFRLFEWRGSNQTKSGAIRKRFTSVGRNRAYGRSSVGGLFEPGVSVGTGGVHVVVYVLVADPFDNRLVKNVYDEWLEQPGSEKAKKYIHTEYHPMAKSITSQLHNW